MTIRACHSLVMCVLLVCMTTGYAGAHDLHVNVWDMTPDVSEEKLEQLDRALDSGSNTGAREAMSAMFEPRKTSNVVVTLQGYAFGVPIDSLGGEKDKHPQATYAERVAMLRRLWEEPTGTDVVVRLRGEPVSRTAISDAKGNAVFVGGWVCGAYELSAKASLPSTTGALRPVTSRQRAVLVPGAGAGWRMEIHANAVTVKGRVTSADGRPIAGAKVTGTAVPCRESGDIVHDCKYKYRYRFSMVTDADGTYELRGFIPPSVYRIASYLGGGDPTEGGLNPKPFFVELRAEADGFVQDEKNVPEVPLVPETLLRPARRLMEIMIRHSEHLSEQEKRDFQERAMPTTHGNTIEGIDIVLDRTSGDTYK